MIFWISSSFAPTSTPLVGSSMIISRGCFISHLAMIVFCWLPPESWLASMVSSTALTWTSAMYSRALAISR